MAKQVDLPVVTSQRMACVGLPVVFGMPDGPVPGVLQRKSLTDDTWDVKISISGAEVWVTRGGVPYSETVKLEHWSFLPTGSF